MEKSLSKTMIGLDVGDATIGIAVSDALGYTAQPYENYRRISKKQDIDYIVDLLIKRSADTVVVGMPSLLDGNIGEQAKKTQSFVEALIKKLKYSSKVEGDVLVKTLDERFTSLEAEKMLKSGGLNRMERSKRVDMVAAAIILQTYLEMERLKKNEQ